jgi:hypothetical protein
MTTTVWVVREPNAEAARATTSRTDRGGQPEGSPGDGLGDGKRETWHVARFLATVESGSRGTWKRAAR